MNIEIVDILTLIAGFVALFILAYAFFVSGEAQRSTDQELDLNDVDNNYNGGFRTTHGMIRDPKGNGVIADSKPSSTHNSSILRN